MLEVGKIVNLNDDKEYIVVNVIELHNVRYAFLMSNFKPLDIVIATEKNVDGQVVLNEVKDNQELDYVLSQFALSDDEEEFDE